MLVLTKLVKFSISNQLKILTRRTFSTLELSKDEIAIQNLCQDFSKNELEPVARELDRNGKFPQSHIDKISKLGLMGICAEPKYGGSGLTTLALSLAVEELSRGCASTGALVSIHNCLYVNLVQRKGNEKQKEKFLKTYTQKNIGVFALSELVAGSDVSAISTTATRDGDHWILNGVKSWVTSAFEAKAGIIFATIDKSLKHKGITAFFISFDTPGITLGNREDKLGIRATSTSDIILENVRVHSENVVGDLGGGFRIAMKQLDQARIGIASQAVGISQAALDTAINYASERISFGEPILKMQAVQLRIAEMALKIELARSLTRTAAVYYDTLPNSTKWSSFAKLAASDCANFCTNNCIQILGGMGFIKDLPAERYYRDAKITEIYGGVTDIHKLIVAGKIIQEYGIKL